MGDAALEQPDLSGCRQGQAHGDGGEVEGGTPHAQAHWPLTEGDPVIMSKHKKSHNHSHQRREQFTQGAPSRRAVSPTMVMLALSALFGVVLVYVIVTGGRASSQVAITEIAGAGSDVTLA